MANPTRNFTGVFIPAKIWVSKELIPAEKMLLGEIDALSNETGWCYASRKHFAEWLQCGLPNVSYYIEKLERFGFLEVERKPGERSKMRIIGDRFHQKRVVNGTDGVVNGTDGVVNGTDGVVNGTDPKYKLNTNNNKDIREVESPVSEKETVSLTTFSPGEKIQNLEVIVVEGVEFSLDADLEQTCTGADESEFQKAMRELPIQPLTDSEREGLRIMADESAKEATAFYSALNMKINKPSRDHDSQTLQDFVSLGTPEQFEETKRRMMKKANNTDAAAAEIITHLNTATGSQFRTAAKTNIALVNARMKEGATVADLKLIVDHKTEQWGTDPKMREHLCPETLFKAGHYEKYINAARKWQQDKSGPVAARYAMNDSPKACTPDEMVREMSLFYRTHLHDGDDGRGLLSAAQKHAQTAYGPDRLNEVVRLFCANRLKNGRGGETFAQQHAALCEWLQNEKKREQRGQGGPAVFNPADLRRRAIQED